MAAHHHLIAAARRHGQQVVVPLQRLRAAHAFDDKVAAQAHQHPGLRIVQADREQTAAVALLTAARLQVDDIEHQPLVIDPLESSDIHIQVLRHHLRRCAALHVQHRKAHPLAQVDADRKPLAGGRQLGLADVGMAVKALHGRRGRAAGRRRISRCGVATGPRQRKHQQRRSQTA